MEVREINTEICFRAIKAVRPDFDVDSIQRIPPGWDNAVFLVNREWIFRFPTRRVVAVTLEREISLIPLIAERTATPVPRFDFVGRVDEIWPFPFVGYYRLPGRPLGPEVDALAFDIVRSAADPLGAFLSRLHQIPFQPALETGLDPFEIESWIDERANLINTALDAASRALSSRTIDTVRDHYQMLFEQIDWHLIEPALNHGDLVPEHILLDLEGAVRIAIIDFGDVQFGDPAVDFAGLPDRILQPVLDVYQLDLGADFPLRRSLYRDLVPAYALEAGVELGRDDLFQEGITGLQTLTERIRWLKN